MLSRISARALTAALGGWRTREPAYEALADGIRLLCLDNRIAPRTALPAERELAAALGLSRSTVAAAYGSLRASGHIESVRGSGSITMPLGRRDVGRVTPDTDSIDLQQASPAAWPGLAGVIAAVASDAPSIVARSGYDVLGTPALRALIADDYSARGIATDPSQIMVTTGAQSAIHLIAGVLVGRGDPVVLETPTYPHAADAFAAAGARLIGVPVTTQDGWDLDRATQVFSRSLPVLAYLMPRFQNPTGRTMRPEEQQTILTAAERAGTFLVLDETTADLGIDQTSAEASFAIAPASSRTVLRVGSLGKTVWGGLRIGWIRADPDVIRRLVAARPARELGTPELEQAIAAALFAHMPAIREQRSAVLREGRDALTAALSAHIPEWQVPSTAGGVALWVGLGAPLSSSLVLRARNEGVLLSAGPRFSIDGGHERHLRLPFTAPADQLVRAVEVLSRAWDRVRGETPAQFGEPLEAVV
ncbi:PLP-dependent aminotransferase family protein [Microbacterium sp. zg-YB36]|uniref:MocR-like transcription factor YczR n=1 Tax=Microbacterium sp. zg-YB36 TaxID=2969407 RepID=UPI00214BA2E0|nr:PLP-dependent aminotransferase family protein [Microbacterium sp. zg-YB36]MDL5350398.1 PLP-dependent aminotransferase family protein [Microbacterium sp. zg-YB36]